MLMVIFALSNFVCLGIQMRKEVLVAHNCHMAVGQLLQEKSHIFSSDSDVVVTLDFVGVALCHHHLEQGLLKAN